MEFDKIPLELEPLGASALEAFSASAQGKGLKLDYRFDVALPAWVGGDPSRLRQILHNLIGNALKFTDSDTVTLHVGADGAGMVRFAVSDQGTGIDPAKQDDLFKELTKLGSDYSRRYGGTGLGLAISKKLVTLMGGEIGVDSAPGEGSTFWFRVHLPETPPPDRKPDVGPRAAKGAACGPSALVDFSGYRILLAEDSETNRVLIRSLLRKTGIAVDVAEDGSEAISLFQKNHYDLVLMDVSMPNLDGIQTTVIVRAMGERTKDIPIIALTAHALPADRERCLAAGMDDYVTKPIVGITLRRVLAKWLPGAALSEVEATTPSEPIKTVEPLPEQQLAEGFGPNKIVDNIILDSITAEVGVDTVGTLLGTFLDEVPRRVSRIQECHAAEDLGEISGEAHTLKRSAETFGAVRLRDRARDIEMAAKRNDADSLANLMSDLMPVSKLTRNALVAYRQELEADNTAA